MLNSDISDHAKIPFLEYPDVLSAIEDPNGTS
jgi:hypothetical protein